MCPMKVPVPAGSVRIAVHKRKPPREVAAMLRETGAEVTHLMVQGEYGSPLLCAARRLQPRAL